VRPLPPQALARLEKFRGNGADESVVKAWGARHRPQVRADPRAGRCNTLAMLPVQYNAIPSPQP
jgi:hypothetical protein